MERVSRTATSTVVRLLPMMALTVDAHLSACKQTDLVVSYNEDSLRSDILRSITGKWLLNINVMAVHIPLNLRMKSVERCCRYHLDYLRR